MEIKVSTENGKVPVTVVHVDGNIDSSSNEAFEAKLDELINEGARYILVDLAHAPFVSSAGLRTLHAIYKKLGTLHPDAELSEADVKKGIMAGTYKSPHLKLVNLSEGTKTTFELSGYDMFLDTFSDTKTAIASY